MQLPGGEEEQLQGGGERQRYKRFARCPQKLNESESRSKKKLWQLLQVPELQVDSPLSLSLALSLSRSLCLLLATVIRYVFPIFPWQIMKAAEKERRQQRKGRERRGEERNGEERQGMPRRKDTVPQHKVPHAK